MKRLKTTEATHDDFKRRHRSGGNIARTVVRSLVWNYYINQYDTRIRFNLNETIKKDFLKIYLWI